MSVTTPPAPQPNSIVPAPSPVLQGRPSMSSKDVSPVPGAPCGPVGPRAPGAPSTPFVPAGPGAPRAPFVPAAPVTPAAPADPVAPRRPATPAGPVGPAGPVTFQVTNRSLG